MSGRSWYSGNTVIPVVNGAVALLQIGTLVYVVSVRHPWLKARDWKPLRSEPGWALFRSHERYTTNTRKFSTRRDKGPARYGLAIRFPEFSLEIDKRHQYPDNTLVPFAFREMLPANGLFAATPPTVPVPESDTERLQVAIQEAREGIKEGGIPIGAALVRHQNFSQLNRAVRLTIYLLIQFTSDGRLLGVGRNRRVQKGSATRHGEVVQIPPLYANLCSYIPD